MKHATKPRSQVYGMSPKQVSRTEGIASALIKRGLASYPRLFAMTNEGIVVPRDALLLLNKFGREHGEQKNGVHELVAAMAVEGLTVRIADDHIVLRASQFGLTTVGLLPYGILDWRGYSDRSIQHGLGDFETTAQRNRIKHGNDVLKRYRLPSHIGEGVKTSHFKVLA
jgi:hypothetical protein